MNRCICGGVAADVVRSEKVVTQTVQMVDFSDNWVLAKVYLEGVCGGAKCVLEWW